MIIDLPRFVAAERPHWAELEQILAHLEAEPNDAPARARPVALPSVVAGVVTPQDVGNVITLFCSERAGWITGQVIYADGGASLMNPEVPTEIQIGEPAPEERPTPAASKKREFA